ncbi:sulfurtransferase [bacterium]|nr:sulfurtransferase [bacterium]
MRPLITVDNLMKLQTPVLRLDCRYDLADPGDGRVRYGRGHLPGASYVSLDDDLCAPLHEHGGRHPLPSIEAMTVLFSRLGVERNGTHVVVYDDEGGCYAARLWWMLRYMGHERVQVLDGGFSAWQTNGGEVTKEVPDRVPAAFEADVQQEMLASLKDVVEKPAPELLIDCRAAERFAGKHEPIDRVAGHIPGAFNMPWMELVGEDGSLRPLGELSELLIGVDERSIMYCGSGVTACVNVLAAEQSSLGLPRLYAGGWSDWITWPENPIAREG